VKRRPKSSTDFDWLRFCVAILVLAGMMFVQGAFCTPDELDREYKTL